MHSTNHPHHTTHLLSWYADYVPSDTVILQLLKLDNDELAIPLPSGPTSASDVICNILQADLTLNRKIAHLASDDERDPPTVRHAQRSQHFGEWLATMHKELKALKAKEVYEEVDNLLPGHKAVKSKWVLHIKRDKEG